MKCSLGLASFLVLTMRSLAFCPPAIRTSLSYSTSDSDVIKGTDVCARWSFVLDYTSTRCLGGSTRRSSWRGHRSSRKGSILMSSVGSTVAPPPQTLSTDRGGGEDGMRELTREESKAAVESFAANAETHLVVQSDYTEFMESLDRMRAWVGALDKKRVGCKRMVLGSFKCGKLLSIVAAEVVWSTGSLSRDVRICSRLIVVNPAHDKRTIGFATVDQLKSFGRQNALLLDLSPMMAVPSCRVFCLASMQTLDEDPEQLLQDPIVQQFNSRVRRCCYILDDIPDWADLGPYWYEGALPRSVRFFFRKKFHAVNEFEVTLQWPGAGLATGSGTVGGARVLPMEEAEAAKDIPGHRKVREIERRLANRLLADMQDENPVLNE